MKKIEVFVNGIYVYTTNQFKTCKEAKDELMNKKTVEVASIPNYMLKVNKNDKIVAHFSKMF